MRGARSRAQGSCACGISDRHGVSCRWRAVPNGCLLVSTLDVVAEVLREVAPRALNARQIVSLAAGRLPTASRTPETVVSRDLAVELKHADGRSRFLRVD